MSTPERHSPTSFQEPLRLVADIAMKHGTGTGGSDERAKVFPDIDGSEYWVSVGGERSVGRGYCLAFFEKTNDGVTDSYYFNPDGTIYNEKSPEGVYLGESTGEEIVRTDDIDVEKRAELLQELIDLRDKVS